LFSIMAEFSTQDGGVILADDLMRDRARQFVEFLDDDVRLDPSFVKLRGLTTVMRRRKPTTTTGRRSSGCSISSRSG